MGVTPQVWAISAMVNWRALYMRWAFAVRGAQGVELQSVATREPDPGQSDAAVQHRTGLDVGSAVAIASITAPLVYAR